MTAYSHQVEQPSNKTALERSKRKLSLVPKGFAAINTACLQGKFVLLVKPDQLETNNQKIIVPEIKSTPSGIHPNKRGSWTLP